MLVYSRVRGYDQSASAGSQLFWRAIESAGCLLRWHYYVDLLTPKSLGLQVKLVQEAVNLKGWMGATHSSHITHAQVCVCVTKLDRVRMPSAVTAAQFATTGPCVILAHGRACFCESD